MRREIMSVDLFLSFPGNRSDKSSAKRQTKNERSRGERERERKKEDKREQEACDREGGRTESEDERGDQGDRKARDSLSLSLSRSLVLKGFPSMMCSLTRAPDERQQRRSVLQPFSLPFLLDSRSFDVVSHHLLCPSLLWCHCTVSVC